ncbi:hypothetical protein PLICRDRAFT_254449 [Plicaturopsis crispa FD-325 SS-3]|nr:hypothetical protein PLICRDRAFT_254449 [Plicaturopsis crispa FD-325 SS-3]
MDEDTSSTAPAEDPRPLKRIRLDTDAAQSSPADDSAKNDAPVDPLPSERIKPVTDVAHPSPVDDGGKDDAKIASGSAKKSKDTAKRDSAGWAKSRRGKDKDGKNAGRRGRTSRNDEDAAKGERVEGEDGVQKQKAPRLPKRLCALLIGFCGTGCNGMQMCVVISLESTYRRHTLRRMRTCFRQSAKCAHH